MALPLSILDLATIGQNETIAQSLAGSVALAQRAEEVGYSRVWYAEHHNMKSIASSATSVLIAHVAAHTKEIRLGAGGVMLPNHAPLVIAEHYGTLAELHPGRIDLGLGRAPGSDQTTQRALRRDPGAAESFPQDVIELQGYLSDESKVPGIEAIPGRETHVPLYILGSSLFGAQLAAALGLPYAFASHFAPAMLHEAIGAYRGNFQPSDQLSEPYFIAAANVVAADSEAEARAQMQATLRARVRLFAAAGREISDEEADAFLESPGGQRIAAMMQYSAVGTADGVREYLTGFAADTRADELITAHQGPTVAARLRSVELTAQAWGLHPKTAA